MEQEKTECKVFKMVLGGATNEEPVIKELPNVPYNIENNDLLDTAARIFGKGHKAFSFLSFIDHDEVIKYGTKGQGFTLYEHVKLLLHARPNTISCTYNAREMTVKIHVTNSSGGEIMVMDNVPATVGNKELLVKICKKFDAGEPEDSQLVFQLNHKSLTGGGSEYSLKEYLKDTCKNFKVPERIHCVFTPVARGGRL